MELAERWRPWVRAGIWLVAFLIACWVFVAVKSRPLFVSLLAVFAVVEAARRLHDTIRRELLATGSMNRVRAALLAAMPAAGVVLFVVWRVTHRDGFGFFGIALFLLGAGVAVSELRRDLSLSRTVGLGMFGACAFLATIGALSLAIFGATFGWWSVGLAVVLAPVALGLLSEVGIEGLGRLDRRVHLAIPVIGLVLFAAGLWFMADHVNDVYAYLFCAALLVLMVAIAVRSSADALLVVAMTGLVWALSHRTVPVPESLAVADGNRVVVALGDSYISGEGADEFYEGTNRKGSNECRRAPTAYPVSLIEEEHPAIPEHLHLVFLACSGATTDGVRTQLAQVRDLRRDADLDVRFVLLSVGGNDALFGSVAETCLLPGDCSTLGRAWVANLDQVRDSLDAVYRTVDSTFGGVPVLVVPYPVPLRQEYCSSSGFTRNEHAFLHQFADAVNEVLHSAAADAGFHYVDTMPGSLARAQARLCDEGDVEVGVNFLDMNSVVGTLEQASNPLNWFHNSLHPNEHGHDLMRESLVQWLDRNPTLDSRATLDPDMADTRPVVADDGGPCRDSSDLQACTGRWSRQQTGRLLITEGWITLLIAAGIAMVVLPLVRQARLLFDDDSRDRNRRRR